MLKHPKKPGNRQLIYSLAVLFILFSSTNLQAQGRRKPAPPGMPNEVQMTPYKTTMLANGKDDALINIKIIDSKGDSLPNAKEHLVLTLKGDARILRAGKADNFKSTTDSTWEADITGGCLITLRAGRIRGMIKFTAKADSLWPGSTEIQTVQPGKPHLVTTDKYIPEKVTDKIIGTDISFLPQIES